VTLFPVIRDWIAEFLLDIRDMTASEIGRNMLIEQVRSLCVPALRMLSHVFSRFLFRRPTS